MVNRLGGTTRRWVAAGLLGAGLGLSVAAQAVPVISVGSATVGIGNTFTIPVLITGATDLQAFQFDLAYAPAILSVLGFTDAGTDFEAAAAAGGGFLTGITGFDLGGTLSGVADSMSGASSGLSGSGLLVQIEFSALAAGTSALTLSNVLLDFSDSGFDVTNGTVCVRASPRCTSRRSWRGSGATTNTRWAPNCAIKAARW
jgi:general secretion pathway protein D